MLSKKAAIANFTLIFFTFVFAEGDDGKECKLSNATEVSVFSR
jgi:hypothetical protein